MSESSKFKRFGKYLILDHLVNGGMAKICRARYLGEQADKIVAIKMVRSKFSNNESFKKMFMDEVKVSFSLQHQNIVQTYDYGMHKKHFYVAMEYCDGENLRDYLIALKEKKSTVPVEIATYIICQVCQGLFYAHTLKDKLTGNELNIVHRDISPHNIMLTYDGAVKIIDFGIAKADSNSEVTEAGTIKGKLSYLAPEYLDGMSLNGLYDQFSLGVTFWELLTMEKLFHGKNDLLVLKKIQKCEVPAPSTRNPQVPKELDDIVLKSLAKNRDERFKNLSEMNKALTKFLYQYKQDFNTADMAFFATELFKDQIEKDRQKFVAFGKIDIKPYLNELKQDDDTVETDGGSLVQGHDKSIVAKKSYKRDRTVLKLAENEVIGEDGRVKTKGHTATDLKLSSHASRTVSLSANARTMKAFRKRNVHHHGYHPHTETYTRSKPTSFLFKICFVACIATIFFYSEEIPWINKVIGKEKLDKIQKIRNDFLKKVTGIIKKKSKRRQPSSLGPTGPIKLANINKFKQKFFVDGAKVTVNVMNKIQVPLNKEVSMRIETPKKRHFVKSITLKPNENNKTITYNDQGPEIYGYLFSSSACFSGHIAFSLFGEKRREPMPLERPIGFPLISQEIFLMKDDGTVEKKTFRPRRENGTTDVCKL